MEIVKVENQNVFRFSKVEYVEATAKDFTIAEKIAKQSSGHKYNLALVSRCCKFDGQKYPMEELEKLNGDDFLELSLAVLGHSQSDLEKPLSTSQDTAE